MKCAGCGLIDHGMFRGAKIAPRKTFGSRKRDGRRTEDMLLEKSGREKDQLRMS